MTIYPKPPHKIYLVLIFLHFIGANETIFEIPARFADKSYPPIPPGNINPPVPVVSKPVAASHPMKLVAVNVRSPQTLKKTCWLNLFWKESLSCYWTQLIWARHPFFQMVSGFPLQITWPPHFRSLPVISGSGDVISGWARKPLATPWSAVAFPVSNSENQSEASIRSHMSVHYY